MRRHLEFLILIMLSFAPVGVAQSDSAPSNAPKPSAAETPAELPVNPLSSTTTSLSNSSSNAPASTSQTPCAQPAELFSASEYTGPLKRVAAWFSRLPEITTVPTRRKNGKNGKNICALNAGEKFSLFANTTFNPATFLGAGAGAGVSQWQNYDSEWGQGAEAYGKRYAAAFTDLAAHNFFGTFFYPLIFQQDPRYYRQGNGKIRQRLGHALAHTFVARSDSGKPMPNFSVWAEAASTAALGNLYHPGNDRGFAPAARGVGVGVACNMGIDVLKEFWPGIVHKLRLPFRERKIITTGPAAKP